MATKTNWSAIANANNDMTSAAWVREVQMPYVRLCEAMNVVALHQSACPMELKVTDKCVKNMYMKDFALRHEGGATLAIAQVMPLLFCAARCKAEGPELRHGRPSHLRHASRRTRFALKLTSSWRNPLQF